MEQFDPMCTVPVSYLNMLQSRTEARLPHETNHLVAWEPSSREQLLQSHTAALRDDDAAQEELARAIQERNQALGRIAAFEERAGCALEAIPVEALGEAQNQYVNQQAIDTLKRENDGYGRRINAAESEIADWRGRYKESQRELAQALEAATQAQADKAPWGYTVAGVPKKKPGSKAKRRAA